jgi:hypothetical protein
MGNAFGAEPKPWEPESYPDAEGFETRKQVVLEGVANGGLDKWRRGYFAGGDPGKYLPGHAMAKLLVNPEDPEPAQYMNDSRSYKEHYHFAVVNWARFWPLFGDTQLTEDTKAKFAERMKRYNYLSPGGTENHKTMWWTSANVLPHFTGVGTNSKSKEETLAQAKEILRDYVKGLFMAGQGEWDSSTYMMFDVNGLLNIYDFSPDAESRLMAQAALDVLMAGYALKYTDGVYTGPNQRGYAKGPYESIADQTGYVWWGGHKQLTADDTRAFRYTIHPITSTWRPGRVISNLATRNVEGLPAEQRNSKANYWHGQGLPPKPGASHETVYIHPRFTLGSLWDQHASQHTRFQLAVTSSKGAVVFTGGHPRKSDHNGKKVGMGFRDGTGRFVQSAQSGPVYLCMVRAPEEEEHDYAYFTVPEGFLEPATVGSWKVFDVEGVQVAVRALTGDVTTGTTPPDKKGNTSPLLKMPGRNTGFLLWVLEDSTDLKEKLESVTLDASAYETTGKVLVEVPGVTSMTATFQPDPNGDNHGSRAAKVVIDGQPVVLSDWPIYGGPFIHQTPGVVSISDGREGFTIDFTGELPEYKENSAP